MKLVNKCKKAAILATVLSGLCLSTSAEAATILVGGGTDYKTGTQIGALTGSWVTSHVNTNVIKDTAMKWFDFNTFAYDYYSNNDKITEDWRYPYKYFYDHHPDYKNTTRSFDECADEIMSRFSDFVMAFPYGQAEDTFLAPDCDIFRVVLNGKSFAFVRQTSGAGTILMDGIAIDPNVWTDLGSGQYKGKTDSINAHAAVGKGKFVYLADYTGCRIGVGELSENNNTILNRADLTIDIEEDLAKNAGIDFSDGTYFLHGESMLVDGDYLYVLTNVNKGNEWQDYQSSYLIKYVIQPNGALKYLTYTTMGKNCDMSAISKFNDHIFTTAIGGYQKDGQISENTSLDFVNVTESGLFGKNGKINLPDNVTANPSEFRNLRILPNGTAYVLRYNILANGDKTDMQVYKTTVSNLLAEKSQDWEVVVSGKNIPGWFDAVDAEYYTKRVWVRTGNGLTLYVDGKVVHTWQGKDFASSEMFSTMQTFEVMTPEGINGTLAKLELATGEQAADNANAVWNDSAAVESITGDKTLTGDTAITADNSKVDLGNNILAAVYAKDNNISINATNLQLQSKNNVATPVGIYAGNGKEVNITADKLNIITKGYEGGNSLTNAIWLDPSATGNQAKIAIEAPVNISMTGGIGGNGIAIQKTDRWGESSTAAAEKAEVIIKGDVNVKGADNKTWGIDANTENVFSRFNNAGILTAVNNSSVTVDGNVYLDVYGNGIATTAEGSTVTVNGGEITVPTGTGYGYYTLASYLGTINMNTGTDGANPGANDVKLDGDIFALSTGNINLALNTDESYLNGVIDNAGKTNLWLSNGAIWRNEANNSRYYLDNEDAGSFVGGNKVSHVNKFVGGSSQYNVGIIYQGLNSSNIKIDDYSGNTMVVYEHDAANNITGGTITISNAANDSTIALRTEYDGSMNDREVRNKVLNDLADKLYYTAYSSGQTNLSGTVGITEGLLTQAEDKWIGKLTFENTNGQGNAEINEYVKTYRDSISADSISSNEAFNGVYSADGNDHKLDFSAVTGTNEDGEEKSADIVKVEPTTDVEQVISNNDSNAKLIINMGGKELAVTGTANSEGAYANGIAAVDGGKVEINEATNITITSKAENGTASAIYANGTDAEIKINTKDVANIVNLVAAGGDGAAVLHADNQAKVEIGASVNITETNGNAAIMVGKGAEVIVNGGNIGGDKDKVAIRVVDGGKINLNHDGKNKVKTKGHIVFEKESVAKMFRLIRNTVQTDPATVENKFEYTVAGSNHDGDFVNNTGEARNTAVKFSNGATWTGNGRGLNMNVELSGDGTVWTGYFDEQIENEASHIMTLALDAEGSTPAATLDLVLNEGALWKNTKTTATNVKTMSGEGGFVQMGEGAMTVDSYKGATTFVYVNKEGVVEGGSLTITKVADDVDSAKLTLRTGAIGSSEEAKLKVALNNLADKLTYEEANTSQGDVAVASNEQLKLEAKAEIADGLVTPKYYADGNVLFDGTGKAYFDDDSLKIYISGEGNVTTEGTTATNIATSAMASTVMMWRNESDDVMQRMGDLRLGTEESGIWAKYYNGSASYNENKTNYSSDYKAYQVGFDRKLENGWIVGAALSYNEAEHKYAMGAKGEGEAVSVSAYGAWNNDKGHFANVVVKGSQLDNEYNLFNEVKTLEADGDYSTWGLSVSAEYGRRMEQSNGFYFEPSAKLTIGRVQDADYTVATDKGQKMYVQAGFNSIVGELGLGMGKRFEKGNVYTKLAVAHEFAGDFDSSYTDDAYNRINSNVDLGGSWCEWQIGGNMKMNDNSYIYATYEKAFGGDAALDWRVDAGVRWTF